MWNWKARKAFSKPLCSLLLILSEGASKTELFDIPDDLPFDSINLATNLHIQHKIRYASQYSMKKHTHIRARGTRLSFLLFSFLIKRYVRDLLTSGATLCNPMNHIIWWAPSYITFCMCMWFGHNVERIIVWECVKRRNWLRRGDLARVNGDIMSESSSGFAWQIRCTARICTGANTTHNCKLQ